VAKAKRDHLVERALPNLAKKKFPPRAGGQQPEKGGPTAKITGTLKRAGGAKPTIVDVSVKDKDPERMGMERGWGGVYAVCSNGDLQARPSQINTALMETRKENTLKKKSDKCRRDGGEGARQAGGRVSRIHGKKRQGAADGVHSPH